MLAKPVDERMLAGQFLLQEPFDRFQFLRRRRIQRAEVIGDRNSLDPLVSALPSRIIRRLLL